MLPMLKKSVQSLGLGIIMLNKDLLHMSHYGHNNKCVLFTEDLEQYLVYMDFHQLFLNGGDITIILTDSNWSRGLVLCVPARKQT